MADKYSYRPGKKKKTQKQQAPANIQTSSAVYKTGGAKSAAAEPKSVAVSAVISAKPAEIGQAGVRIANLGSELRRFAILGLVIVGTLVLAAFALG
ncbi:hypothetical protein [Dehalogenimonas sp. 4OHTPN]|uniref:Uncharacterized protein n=1 Tax=Dehalogenimonas sp. 4OHTPN TaxID=3166643 RepID=A0AAU8G857_9CHLR